MCVPRYEPNDYKCRVLLLAAKQQVAYRREACSSAKAEMQAESQAQVTFVLRLAHEAADYYQPHLHDG